MSGIGVERLGVQHCQHGLRRPGQIDLDPVHCPRGYRLLDHQGPVHHRVIRAVVGIGPWLRRRRERLRLTASISTLNVLPESAVTECSAGSEFLTAIVAPAGTDSRGVEREVLDRDGGGGAGRCGRLAVADVAVSAVVVDVTPPQAVTVATTVNAATSKSPILLMGWTRSTAACKFTTHPADLAFRRAVRISAQNRAASRTDSSHRPGLPTQFAPGLAAIDVGLGAHQPDRLRGVSCSSLPRRRALTDPSAPIA